jgi:hypothetical protein
MTGIAAWKIALAYSMFFEFTLRGNGLINAVKSNCKMKVHDLLHHDVGLSRCPMPIRRYPTYGWKIFIDSKVCCVRWSGRLDVATSEPTNGRSWPASA